MACLIFDCDGTLIDSELLHAKIESDFAREILNIHRTPLEHNGLFANKGLAHLYRTWEEESGRKLSQDQKDEMIRRKEAYFAKETRPVPYMTEVLETLRAFPSCIASGTPLPTLEVSLKTADLYNYFNPNIFSATMVERGKPAPDIFLYAAKQMKTLPQECIVIEDSPLGVQAGVTAGMKVVGFIGGSHCQPGHADILRKANADVIIADMRELPDTIYALQGQKHP